MAKYINMDKLLEDIEHSVVFTLRPDKPSSINAELRGANKIIDRIRCAPAADVAEARHGRWIYNNMGGWHCSECNNQAPFWCMASTQNLSDYCPNCGARMDGGVNDAADN